MKSVFDHFAGLPLKGLNLIRKKCSASDKTWDMYLQMLANSNAFL